MKWIATALVLLALLAALQASSNTCRGLSPKYGLVCDTSVVPPPLPSAEGCAFPAEMPCVFGG